jgi:hypothetical protein
MPLVAPLASGSGSCSTIVETRTEEGSVVVVEVGAVVAVLVPHGPQVKRPWSTITYSGSFALPATGTWEYSAA